MSWSTALIVALAWMGVTIIYYIIIGFIDKKMHVLDHTGFADLGRALVRVVFTIVPALLILDVNAVIRAARFGIGGFFLGLFAVIFTVPILLFIKTRIYNPERAAKKCRKKTGEYEAFREKFLKEEEYHSTKTSAEKEIVESYIWNQFKVLVDTLGIGYRICSDKKRKEYAEAIIRRNSDLLQKLVSWDYKDDDDKDGTTSRLYLRYKDGSRSDLTIYWESLLLVFLVVIRAVIMPWISFGRKRK